MGFIRTGSFFLALAFLLAPASPSSVGKPTLNSNSPQWPGGSRISKLVVKNSPYTVRLPKNVLPLKYSLKIRPVLERNPDFPLIGSAPGNVTIQFKILKETDMIVLHAHNMSINQNGVKLINLGSGAEVPIKSQERNDEHQTYTIVTGEKLPAGDVTYEVTIPFLSFMLNKRVGLYSFIYPDIMEQKMRMGAASQFQPFHAREAFPCFDEPHFRSEFDVGIGRMDKYQSFSNTRIKETVPCTVQGWVWDMYETSPLMPANLVNVVVVDGYAAETADASITPNTTVQIWAPEALIERKGGEYGASLTAKMIQHFSEYFDYPFMLSKLDSILVWQTEGPAMEHWGSITYGLGGASLLYFPGVTPEWKRFNVASLIAHEVLHQWIGNLVACDWWTDIWIHEGFADYFSDEAVHKFQPEFQSNLIFINSHFQRALQADQARRTHPVNHIFSMTKGQAEDDETTDAFDDIAYTKGASLVHMMKNFLTEPVFKEGLRQFIKNNAYKAINQTHVFDAFNSAASGLPTGVKEIMDTWTFQPGYPYVEVKVKGENQLGFTQKKFRTVMDREETSMEKWWVPLKIITADMPMTPDQPQLWMSDTAAEVVYDKIDTSKWLLVNPDATGFFRVGYDKPLLGKIRDQLNADHTVFSPTTRSQLLDDHFTFANFKYVDLEDALDLTTYMAKEKELVVWNVVFRHLKTAINMFSTNAEFDGMQKYLVPKIDAVLSMPEVNVAQNKDDRGMPVLLRMELLKFGCMLKSPVCENYVKGLTSMWMANNDTNVIPLDLQPVMFCAAVAAGGEDVWAFVKNIYHHTPPTELKMFLFKALSCSRDERTLKMFLEDSWNPMSQYGPVEALESMADNPIANTLVFDSLKANYKKLRPEDIAMILNVLSEYWVHPDLIDDMNKFVEENRDFFQQHMDRLTGEIESHRANAIWMDTTGKQMDVWFNSKNTM